MGLSLKLFGAFVVRNASGAELPLRTRKTRALLAYLAFKPNTPYPRERLMALLWGDRNERQARQSLNDALASIRRLSSSGDPALLDSDGEQVTLRGAGLETDVGRFHALCGDNPATAAALYDGPFLDGLSVPAPAFEEWLIATRLALEKDACDALRRAADTAAEAGDAGQAMEMARRLIALDPLREDAHRRLMVYLYETGDRIGALRQYQVCADVLKRELGVEPDRTTTALFEEIRHGGLTSGTPSMPSPASNAPTAHLSWPDKPSIAVMPFDSVGDDASGKFFAEGLTEDVITTLAKVPGLSVISGHSTRFYQGKAALAQYIGETFNVGYFLKGVVRSYGGRLRCSVQLVDTVGGQHLWAERFDKEHEDIFALQDEIVRRVLVELQVRLTEGEGARIESRGTRNMESWLLRVQGAAGLRSGTREGVARARELFTAAHKADTNWSRPIAGVAACHAYDARNGWSASREESFAVGIEYAERAIALDPNDPLGYIVLSFIKARLRNHDEALALSEKAVELAPNDQMALGNLGYQLIWLDEPDKAIATFERRRRLSPVPSKIFERYYGLALHIVGRVDDAIANLETLARHEPEYIEGLAQLAAAYVDAGRFDSAQEIVTTLMKQEPTYTVSDFIATAIRFPDTKRTEWLRALLVKAGLPE